MVLWTLLLTVFGALGSYAACPPPQLILPCTCQVIKDKFGDDFSVLTCKNVNSEVLVHILTSATRGQKLFELQIVDSTLRYIPHDAFLGTSFKVISFENSSISSLSDTNVAFQGLENSLRLLEIINCTYLTNWNWSQLSHLKHLMEVVVTHSSLMDIANDLSAVQHIEFESFVLQQNNIQWLDSHVFSTFELLTRVTLDMNHIEHVERTMLPRPAKHLKILGLSYNKLSSLPEDIFMDMPVLSSLYLTGNPLQIIDEATFRPIWYHIRLFFFSGTQLSCDCRLSWITKTDNSQKYIHAICNSPEHVRGRHLISMQSHELLC